MTQLLLHFRTSASLALLLASCSFIGCNPASQQAEAPNSTSQQAEAPSTPAPDNAASTASTQTLLPGKAAPDFSLPTVKGETVKLSDTAGQVRLVAFWSTTCIPCIKELPVLKMIQQTYGDQGFQILYLSPDPLEIQKPFLEKRQVTFPSLITDEKTLEAYGVEELPKMALVNREGRILKEYLGETKAEVLEADVKAALAQAS